MESKSIYEYEGVSFPKNLEEWIFLNEDYWETICGTWTGTISRKLIHRCYADLQFLEKIGSEYKVLRLIIEEKFKEELKNPTKVKIIKRKIRRTDNPRSGMRG